jgi:hypothetical protein
MKTAGCWQWTSTLTAGGYGHFQISQPWRKKFTASRYAYEEAFGPISAGLQLDHLCHTQDPTCFDGNRCAHRRCVRPDHLEAVTHAENRKRARGRKAKCPQGHVVDGINIRGDRYCCVCAREASRRYRVNAAHKRVREMSEGET